MYTLKVLETRQTVHDKDGYRIEPKLDYDIVRTHFFECKNVNYHRVYLKENEDKTPAEATMNLIQSAESPLIINGKNDEHSAFVVVINYTDEKEERRSMVIYQPADCYLMQGNKTVERIYV